MKKYVVQFRFRDWDQWETLPPRFETPREAQDYIDRRSFPKKHRIAEAYTVERYKAYRGPIF